MIPTEYKETLGAFTMMFWIGMLLVGAYVFNAPVFLAHAVLLGALYDSIPRIITSYIKYHNIEIKHAK